jgi:hypothetical protein
LKGGSPFRYHEPHDGGEAYSEKWWFFTIFWADLSALTVVHSNYLIDCIGFLIFIFGARKWGMLSI